MRRIILSVVLSVLASGCLTDKIHSLMRAKPAELSDFLPNHERLVRRADTFPFHYTWMNTNAVLKAAFTNIYIAPFDVSHLREGNGYDSLRDKAIGLDDAITELGEYGREAFIQAFRAREGETQLKVVDDSTLPHTMVLELAITAFVPTRAEIEVVGTVGSFFCPIPGVGLVADALAAGSLAVECRARDSVTKEIVAMYADAEGEPSALLQFAKYTYTSAAKINLKRIAAQTVECCIVEDASQLRRAFPFSFIALPWESDLND